VANGNRGIGGFLPFPTFGGPKEGLGITPVKLAPTQMRFPTARGPVRRTPEPELKETLAPLLPIAVEGIMGLFKGKPETMTDAQYLESIGGLSEGTNLDDVLSNQRKMAQLDAYRQFGEPEEKDRFGMDEIINMIIGSQMGRGAKDYAATSLAIDKQKETSRLSKETSRAAFLKEALKDVNNLQYKTFEDVDKARLGISDYRSGFVDPRGESYVMNDDKSGYTNIRELEGNWIEQKYKPTQSLATQLKDPRLVDLSKKDGELNAKDTALLGTMTLTNEMVRMLDKGIADPTQNPLTTVTSIGNFLNSATANANQVLSYMGGGDVLRAFANADDIQNGVAGSDGREGSGQLAKQLYQAIQSGDDKQMIAAMEAFEKGNPEISFRASLGDMAYNNVRTRATMLQLAYAAAAANGQTGRTLSDKDLAFHLQMVGFGATQDAQTAKDNILGFVDTLIRQTDNVVMGTISENRIRAGQYPLDDKMFTSILAGYWDAPIGADGDPDFSNMDNVTFRNFYSRYGKVPDVVLYQKHKRRGGTEFNPNQTTTIDPGTTLEEDLKAIEDLYN
jgi:flagellar hook-basal body complex protein FliE